MRSIALRFAAWLAVLTMGAMSVPALADAPAEASAAALHFDTAITAVYGSPYPIAGKLDISITSEGLVNGYYHNAYQKAFIQVVGGRDGNYIWFDIGPSNVDLGLPYGYNGRIHFVGTVSSDGSLHGQIFPAYNSSAVGNQDLGNPPSQVVQNSPTYNDQYLFAAKPVEKESASAQP
jgi:hypothetical protein